MTDRRVRAPFRLPARFALLISLVLSVAVGLRADVLPSVVFVSRSLDTSERPADRTMPVHRAASGRLLARSPAGVLQVLVDANAAGAPADTPLDVLDPDVAYDATRIVFSGFSPVDGAWRIYEVGATGSGLRKLTRSDRVLDLTRYGDSATRFETYDDLDPCYLPDGRICVVSTRYPGNAPDERVRSTNLYVMDAGGGNLHRITTERFGADTPAVDPASGEIVYSRWWRTGRRSGTSSEPEPEPEPEPEDPGVPPGSPGYGSPDHQSAEDPESSSDFVSIGREVLTGVDRESFPGVNSWSLASIRPDGTGLRMLSGFRLNRELTQAYRPAFFADGRVIALFIPQTPFFGMPNRNGLRGFPRGAGAPRALGGPQAFADLQRLGIPAAGEDDDDAIEFVYASAVPIDRERMLVTASGPTGADYDIYVQHFGDDSLIRAEGTAGTAELDAVPVQARAVPARLADTATGLMSDLAPRDEAEALADGGSFTFRVENIFFNAAVDEDLPNAPPVGEALEIEFWMAPQLGRSDHLDRPVLLQRSPIPADGRVEVVLPAGVPLFEVLRRGDDTLARGRDGQIFHVGGMNFNRAGQNSAACVGCHAGHSMLTVPADPSWTNLAPSASVSADSQYRPQLPPGEEVAERFPLPLPTFPPQNVVDRRTDVFSEWVAASADAAATLRLEWETALQSRELLVYGPRSSGEIFFGTREQTIGALRVTTFVAGAVQEQLVVSTPLLREGRGLALALDPAKPFDRLDLRIERADVLGSFEGSNGAAIAEIEVIAKVSTLGLPELAGFLRGDANCDLGVDVSDAVRILLTLFAGADPLCCATAADANGDGAVNVSDPVRLLGRLFRGEAALPAPTGGCARGAVTALGCVEESCP